MFVAVISKFFRLTVNNHDIISINRSPIEGFKTIKKSAFSS